MEPPSLTAKRVRIATSGVLHGKNILTSANGLKYLKEERLQSGNFVDAEMTTTDLLPINATLAGQIFDFFQTDLETWLAGKLNNDNTLPTRREFLNKLTGS